MRGGGGRVRGVGYSELAEGSEHICCSTPWLLRGSNSNTDSNDNVFGYELMV